MTGRHHGEEPEPIVEPGKREARQAYRAAWSQFVLAGASGDRKVARVWAGVMDTLREHCVTNRGSYNPTTERLRMAEWKAFVSGIPGYRGWVESQRRQ